MNIYSVHDYVLSIVQSVFAERYNAAERSHEGSSLFFSDWKQRHTVDPKYVFALQWLNACKAVLRLLLCGLMFALLYLKFNPWIIFSVAIFWLLLAYFSNIQNLFIPAVESIYVERSSQYNQTNVHESDVIIIDSVAVAETPHIDNIHSNADDRNNENAKVIGDGDGEKKQHGKRWLTLLIY